MGTGNEFATAQGGLCRAVDRDRPCRNAAAAQERTRLGGAPTTAADIRVLHGFSRCVAGRAPTRARSILAMDFRTAEYQRRLRGLAYDSSSCLPPRGVLEVQRRPLRGRSCGKPSSPARRGRRARPAGRLRSGPARNPSPRRFGDGVSVHGPGGPDLRSPSCSGPRLRAIARPRCSASSRLMPAAASPKEAGSGSTESAFARCSRSRPLG